MKMQEVLFAVIFLCSLLIPASISKADSAAFYAYYTRLDYDIPMPERVFEQEREEKGFFTEDDTVITGKYPDIVVNLGENSQFVFSRETSYLPYWKTTEGKWPVKEIIHRQIDTKCLYSYVRLIESKPDKIIVHWRYMPDLDNVGFSGAAHEIFTITPEGRVTREIKKATGKTDIWSIATESLQLQPNGIKRLSFTPPALTDIQEAVETKSSPVKTGLVGAPIAWWKFDKGIELKGDITKENISKTDCIISGDKTLWEKGVSGTALAFDGYHSKVSLPAPKTPEIKNDLTLQAWVALDAYPWNTAAVVHQSTSGERERKGYSLAVDDQGHPMFMISLDGKWKVITSSQSLDLYKWYHIAGTYDKSSGTICLYIDGVQRGLLSVGKGNISPAKTDILIGLNNTPRKATHHVSEKIRRTPQGSQPVIYGIEGLIDEVQIYDVSLNADEIKRSYNSFKPDVSSRNNPDLQKRILPGEPGPSKNFVAYYTKLKYHDLWDNMFRTSDWPDIVVKFDKKPVSVIYWRGSNYGPGWVTENNNWMSDQSCEVGTEYGCSEHMSDKQCRHSHVRMIENTDARVVIHWRYASIDIMYNFPNEWCWADEYHTIYPDSYAVRYVTYHDGLAGWQDVQFFIPPGKKEEDVISAQAVTVANMKGQTYKMDWSDGIPRNPLKDSNIETVNLKSDYKVVVIFPEGGRIGAWGDRERATENTLFAGPWNHWPVSQIPNDGRFALDTGRVRHAALGGVGPKDKAIYGFTNKPIKTLLPLARSWNRPPKIENTKGCTSQGYQKSERAYHLSAQNQMLAFSIDASDESPIYNPCFVIKNWGSGKAEATLKINGRKIPNEDIRQGITRNTDGNPKLVIWVELQADAPTNFQIINK